MPPPHILMSTAAPPLHTHMHTHTKTLFLQALLLPLTIVSPLVLLLYCPFTPYFFHGCCCPPHTLLFLQALLPSSCIIISKSAAAPSCIIISTSTAAPLMYKYFYECCPFLVHIIISMSDSALPYALLFQ